VLALSIRSEQDFGSIPSIRTTVGALNHATNASEVSATLNNYRPPYGEKVGFEPLLLREALNKIAHADPYRLVFSQMRSSMSLFFLEIIELTLG
jgi:hypothetical protein